MPGRSPGRTSPLVRRRRLAAEMRRLRTDLGKTREEAATFAGVAPATITRMEAALHSPKPSDVLALCRLYGVPEEQTETLVTLARQSRRRGWWQRFHGAIPEWFVCYVGLEEEAGEIRGYHPELVSGLLQTEPYMRAALLAGVAAPSGEELERRVAVRRKRRERLDGPDALRLHVVLHEAVLRRRDEEVMPGQLRHLLEMSGRDNVTIQILPFSAGLHPADGAFEILGFPDPADPDVVYVQHHAGGIYLEESPDLAVYAEVFARLQALALTPEDSRVLLRWLAGLPEAAIIPLSDSPCSFRSSRYLVERPAPRRAPPPVRRVPARIIGGRVDGGEPICWRLRAGPSSPPRVTTAARWRCSARIVCTRRADPQGDHGKYDGGHISCESHHKSARCHPRHPDSRHPSFTWWTSGVP